MKKQLIIKSYMELIKENGSMKDISIKQIADKAGIGKGTIYEYFSSKKEIVNSLVEYMIDKITSMFLISDGYSGLSYVDSLKKFIDNVYEGAISVNEVSMYNQHNFQEVLKIVDMREVIIQKFTVFYKKSIELFRVNIYSKGIKEGITLDDLDDIDILIILKTIFRELSENIEFKMIDSEIMKEKLFNYTYKLLKKTGT